MNQTGNEEQEFRELVHELSGPLLRFAAGFLRDPHAAHDVVQEALLRVWKRRAHRYADSSRAYCYRAVRNQCVSYLRKKKLRKRVESETPAMPEPAVNPQHEAAREAWQRALQLPQELREIVVLHYGHGLTVSEVAEATDSPRGTIATRLRRAIETLRSSVLAAPVALFPDDAAMESALRASPEFASDVHVSSSLITGLEAAVMAGIASKSIWGVAALVALVLLLGLGVTVAAVAGASEPDSVNAPLQVAALDSPDKSNAPDTEVDTEKTPVNTSPTEEPDDQPGSEVSDPSVTPDTAVEPVLLSEIRVIVRGLVVDGDQRPVAHAGVSVARMGELLTPVKPPLASTTSGADGAFEVVFNVEPNDPEFPQSSELLCAWASSHGSLSVGPSTVILRWFAGDEESVHDDLVLQIRPARVTRVRVQDAESNPIAGARVWWRRFAYLLGFGAESAGPEVTPEGRTLEFVTGANGVAEVEVPLDEEMQAVQVFADRYVSAYVTLPGKRDDEREIVVTLTQARSPLTIEVQNTNGQPLADLQANVFWGDDDPLHYPEASLRRRLRTDASGEIVLNEAPAGRMSLCVAVEGYEGGFAEVGDGQDRVVVRLERWNRIEVTFRDENGRALELRDAHFVSSLPSFAGSVGRSLTAEWSGDADEVVVDLSVAGWTPKVRTTLSVKDGLVQTCTVKAPKTPLVITGTVLLPGGEPAAGAGVFFSGGRSEVERAAGQFEADSPDSDALFVNADMRGRFELRLEGYASLWVQSVRRGLRSEPVSVNYRNGVGEVTLTLLGGGSLKLEYSESLAQARPHVVVRDGKGNVAGRVTSGALPVREAVVENLTPGRYTVTLMTGDSRVAPFDGDPYTYEVEIEQGGQARLDLAGVSAVTVNAKLIPSDGALPADGQALVIWIRMGPDDDVSNWRSIGHVLDTHLGANVVLGDGGECEVDILPGRYVVICMGGRDTAWAANIEITDRPAQSHELTMQAFGR